MKIIYDKGVPLDPQARLHLYLAWGCPFCHRILAALAVTGLQSVFSVTWMKNIKGPDGWKVEAEQEPLTAAQSLQEVYQQLQGENNQRYSVPLLVDLDTKSLLSSDSAHIVRLISQGVNGRYQVVRDIAPEKLLTDIDKQNQWLHQQVNRAVYLVGFAESPSEYFVRRLELFTALDTLERSLSAQSWLIGDQLTESDLFLLATLERFDSIYFGLFRCNLKSMSDYPALKQYLNRLRKIEGLADTYNDRLTIEHYYLSTMHVRGEVRELNPTKAIPRHMLNRFYRQS